MKSQILVIILLFCFYSFAQINDKNCKWVQDRFLEENLKCVGKKDEKECFDNVNKNWSGGIYMCKVFYDNRDKKDCPYENKYALCLGRYRLASYCSNDECKKGWNKAASGEYFGGLKVDKVMSNV